MNDSATFQKLFFGKRAEYADEKIADLHALAKVKIFRHIDVKHFQAKIIKDFRQPQQFSRLAGSTIAGEQVSPGAFGKVNINSQLLHRITIFFTMQAADVKLFAQGIFHQTLNPEIDGRVEIQGIEKRLGAAADIAHDLLALHLNILHRNHFILLIPPRRFDYRRIPFPLANQGAGDGRSNIDAAFFDVGLVFPHDLIGHFLFGVHID